ncbi:MAG: LptF/LptG family permease [Paludibacteraceae bacterium]
MLGIKKIDTYIVKSFLAYFFMTFFICMLILLMQFMWKHMAELIGKGVGLDVLAEFFWYASLQTVPMALPLAILLAALMNFGNLGEHFELTAMKSAGISLFRMMRGLIVFIAVISLLAFFFSNNVLPMAQQKLWTLIFSLRQKSPEFDIPESEFYTGINGYNLYVRQKDRNKKLLRDLMIYDYSNGFENSSVTLADSGRVQFTADNKYLKFSLYSGESFENMKQQGTSYVSNNMPYRRETFQTKELLIDFDTEFNRYDESILKDQHVSKNVVQLTQTIDSVSKIVKARGNEQAREMVATQFLEGRDIAGNSSLPLKTDEKLSGNRKQKGSKENYNPDSLFLSLNQQQMEEAMVTARQSAQAMKEKIEYNNVMLSDPIMVVRRHQIEWHRRFTLSFACLIFFFIGAPLGAIIRKGGLGFPIVVSVILFVIYYIIDTTGYKMAREGFWDVFEGMWLSSAVLFPLGLFLTWKAVTDASLFRTESYIRIFDNVKRYFDKQRRKFINKKTSVRVI